MLQSIAISVDFFGRGQLKTTRFYLGGMIRLNERKQLADDYQDMLFQNI